MQKNNNREILQSLAMVLQMGINMIVPIMLCTLLGIRLGDKWNIDWLVVVLFFVGVLAGYTNIYKMVKGMLKDKNDKKENHVKKN